MPEPQKSARPGKQDISIEEYSDEWEDDDELEEPDEESRRPRPVASAPPVLGKPPGRLKRLWNRLTTKQRAALGIAVICLMVVGAFLAPPEGDSTNVTGDMPNTPTVVVTNLIEKVPVNQPFEYKGVKITLLDASLATNFSDDRNRGGLYTLRVMVQTSNPSAQNVGIPYIDFFRLRDANGKIIEPKRIAIKPQEKPNSSQTGFVDFPVDEKASLSTYTLLFGKAVSVPLVAAP